MYCCTVKSFILVEPNFRGIQEIEYIRGDIVSWTGVGLFKMLKTDTRLELIKIIRKGLNLRVLKRNVCLMPLQVVLLTHKDVIKMYQKVTQAWFAHVTNQL